MADRLFRQILSAPDFHRICPAPWRGTRGLSPPVGIRTLPRRQFHRPGSSGPIILVNGPQYTRLPGSVNLKSWIAALRLPARLSA